MARDGGQIVIVSDLGPKRLLRLAENLAYSAQCRLEDLIDDERDGFHIAEGRGGLTFPLILSVASRAHLDVEVFADRTKRGDGRITLDWRVTDATREFVNWFANELERRIKDDDGEVLESYDD